LERGVVSTRGIRALGCAGGHNVRLKFEDP
jgi:hypothetical protein